MKKAVVAVSFGTSVPKAERCIQLLEDDIRQACGDRAFFRAYSSGWIRKKLQSMGTVVPSPAEVLDSLTAQGYEDILLQPTFIIPGIEYDRLCAVADNYGEAVRLGTPLIYDSTDLVAAARVIGETYCPNGEALLLMGHGTGHLANFVFPSLQTAFQTLGRKNCYVATVEGWPTLPDAVVQMKQDGVRQVILAPFLLVAGDHVINDMAGDGAESWVNVLKREGFAVDCRCTGLGELEGIRRLYQEKLRTKEESYGSGNAGKRGVLHSKKTPWQG